MIEQKGPGLPQAACRRLSSSIYLQACAPALPPVWQACPGASSFPSSFQLSPLFSSSSSFCICSFSYLSVFVISTSGIFYSKPVSVHVCVCVAAVSIWVCACMVENNAGSWLYMDPCEENRITVWCILLKTGQGGLGRTATGQDCFFSLFFEFCVTHLLICFLFPMFPHNRPHSRLRALICFFISALSSDDVYKDKTTGTSGVFVALAHLNL